MTYFIVTYTIILFELVQVNGNFARLIFYEQATKTGIRLSYCFQP
jgi:hypothetical protein